MSAGLGQELPAGARGRNLPSQQVALQGRSHAGGIAKGPGEARVPARPVIAPDLKACY